MNLRWFVHKGEVVLTCSESFNWAGLPPEEARRIGEGLIACADEVEGKNKPANSATN